MKNKLLIIVTSAFLFSGCNRLDSHQPRTNIRQPFDEAERIAQSFVSSDDNLNIVAICIRNNARILSPLVFNLYEATSSSTVIRSISINAGNIDNLDCTKFQFAPIPDSQGNTYVAEIYAPESDIYRNGVYVEAYTTNDYLQGTAFQDNIPLEMDLHFKTFFKQDFGVVISSESKKLLMRIFQDKGFFVIYIALLYAIVRKYLSLPKNK